MKALFESAVVLTALTVATGCASPDAPVASPVAPAIVDVAKATTDAAAPVVAAPLAAPGTAPASAVTLHTEGSVRVGNQRVLNFAVVPFAKYLNAMHKRIHVLFADGTLAKLDALPPSDPLNNPKLRTRIEVVIDGKSGQLVKASVVAASGNATFDAFGLDAIQRAAPFEAADPAIWSTDGNVYIHWELWRDEVFACSTMHARPFLLDLGATPP